MHIIWRSVLRAAIATTGAGATYGGCHLLTPHLSQVTDVDPVYSQPAPGQPVPNPGWKIDGLHFYVLTPLAIPPFGGPATEDRYYRSAMRDMQIDWGHADIHSPWSVCTTYLSQLNGILSEEGLGDGPKRIRIEMAEDVADEVAQHGRSYDPALAGVIEDTAGKADTIITDTHHLGRTLAEGIPLLVAAFLCIGWVGYRHVRERLEFWPFFWAFPLTIAAGLSAVRFENGAITAHKPVPVAVCDRWKPEEKIAPPPSLPPPVKSAKPPKKPADHRRRAQ